jgi:hypothetical protein
MAPQQQSAADAFLTTAPLEVLENVLKAHVSTADFAAANVHLTAAELAALRGELVFPADKPLWSPNKPRPRQPPSFYVHCAIAGVSVVLHRLAWVVKARREGLHGTDLALALRGTVSHLIGTYVGSARDWNPNNSCMEGLGRGPFQQPPNQDQAAELL